jgi:hypothetical protein
VPGAVASIATSAAFGAALYRYFAVLFVAGRSEDLEPETARGFFGGLGVGFLAAMLTGA